MKLLRAFLAGSVIPGVTLPVVIFTLIQLKKLFTLASVPIYWMPITWGAWALIYRLTLYNIRILRFPGIIGLVAGLTESWLMIYQFNLMVILEKQFDISISKDLLMAIIVVFYILIWEFIVGSLLDRLLED